MDYTCSNCKTVLTIPDELLKKSKSKLHCFKCGHVVNPTEATPFDSEQLAKVIRQLLNSDLN